MVAPLPASLRSFDIVFLDAGLEYPHVCLQARTSAGVKALQTRKALNVPREDMEQICELCLALGIRLLCIRSSVDEHSFR